MKKTFIFAIASALPFIATVAAASPLSDCYDNILGQCEASDDYEGCYEDMMGLCDNQYPLPTTAGGLDLSGIPAGGPRERIILLLDERGVDANLYLPVAERPDGDDEAGREEERGNETGRPVPGGTQESDDRERDDAAQREQPTQTQPQQEEPRPSDDPTGSNGGSERDPATGSDRTAGAGR